MALLVFLALTPQDTTLELVRKAIDKSSAAGYAYQVKGRFERAGEYLPPGILTSRIRQYQSARHGDRILVKGPEGLWKTPEDRLGEKVEKPDTDAPRIVRTLEGAAPPHRMLEELLALAGNARGPEDRELHGIPCLRVEFRFDEKELRDSVERQMGKAVLEGTLRQPDEVHWSTLKGSLRIYVSRSGGHLVKVTDARSVKISHKIPGREPEARTYTIEMELEFSRWGEANLQLPPEVKFRLGVKDP